MAFSVPTDFTANTVISSSQMNSNFGSVETAINSIHSYIGTGVITNAMLAGSIDLTSKVTGTLPVANGGTEFDTGDICLSTVAKDETGWSEVTGSYANRYLRVGSTGLATGGASTHTHTGPSHNHSVSITSGAASATATFQVGATTAAIAHTHSVSGTTGSGGTGNTSSANNNPLYVDLRLFQRS